MNKLAVIEALVIPSISLKVMLSLAKAVLGRAPSLDVPLVLDAIERLAKAAAQADAALTTRLRERNPELVGAELACDRAVDGLWKLLRDLLASYAAYEHEGFDALAQTPAFTEQLEVMRERAAAARELGERVFGHDGLAFTRLPYIEQAETMAALLRLIDEDELGPALEQVVGPELPVLLGGAVARYTKMIEERLARTSTSGPDLRQMQAQLRRRLNRYVNALTVWADEDDPGRVEQAWEALLPMITVRNYLSRPDRSDDDELIAAIDALEPSGEIVLDVEAEDAPAELSKS